MSGTQRDMKTFCLSYPSNLGLCFVLACSSILVGLIVLCQLCKL